MKEEWKDVVGFEQYFMVSDHGRIYSKRTNKVLKQFKSKTGYWYLATKIGGRVGKDYCFKVHRLVADAFIENVSNKPFVNHIDGNKLNNHISNLEWCTAKENSIHAVENGLINPAKGSKSASSKFDDESVRFIRAVYCERDKIFGARPLARMLNSNHNTILRIVNRTTWNHV